MGELVLNTAVRAGTAFLAGAAQRAVSGLFAPDREGPRLSELALQTSTEGASIPVVYGRMRVAGQVIWAARFTEHAQTRKANGGKGGPKVTEFRYSLSFAVGLCEGPVAGVGRIWANGEELDRSGLVMRFHNGGEDQLPDPLIEAVEGAGHVPAFRGLAYAVFEDLPLDAFGDRIPNLAFEVIAAAPGGEGPRLESLVEGVCLIPASGEFAYSVEPVARELTEGRDASENRHTARAASDIEAALDDLEARLPACGSVALVTSWFGDDLRCAECRLMPGVETRAKTTRPLTWSAAGLTRETAFLVSTHDGAPAFGGTPSDETVIAAIKALKARGYEVTLYPFILMDIPPGAGLPDPYGGAEQAAYPWRGRITLDLAPGQPGSPDKTAAADGQVAAFYGTAQAAHFHVSGEAVSYSGPDEWSFSRFILHHAALAKAAGGVESFIIGSEMRALTQARSGPADYPFVERLGTLAGEARALLGPQVNLSYAADWSEYYGHAPQDGSGDRIFHLDPLWSHPDIDYAGLDFYIPLADWREGSAHADALAGARSVHDPDYLAANVEGGEGYDWFYEDAAARDAQARTPITDGGYGEPWIWRFKDIRNWWANAHHNRIGGVRQSAPTGWIAKGKPLRLVELGCPAVDKGANQPNVFIDPKSSESFAPYFSTGARDDLMQRRYIEALLDYWAPAHGRNPQSDVYGGPMLDLARSHVWTWDARPFPEFPARTDVWTDGANWRRGHWLTGRAGQSPLAQIVADIARRAGLETLDVTRIEGVLAGFVIDRTARARDILEALGAVFGFVIADRADGPVCLPAAPQAAPSALASGSLAGAGEGLSFLRTPVEDLPSEARLTVLTDDGDYRPASVYARGLDHVRDGLMDLALPALADRDLAARWAQGALTRARAEGERARLALPPSLSFLEPGDAVTLDAGPQGRVWRLAGLHGLNVRTGELTGAAPGAALAAGPEPGAGDAAAPPSRPLLRLLDLPLAPGEARNGLWAAVWADPWPGEIIVFAGPDSESAAERARISAPAFCGELTAPLGPGFEGRIDRSGKVRLRLKDGALASVSRLAMLAGANRLAVEASSGWEVLGFETAVLTGPDEWEVSGLLRGLGGSPKEGAPAGARAVLLDGAGAVIALSGDERGAPLAFTALAPGEALSSASARTVEAIYQGADLRPLSPVHLRARHAGGTVHVSWIRRGRVDADAWAGEIPLGEEAERYAVTVLNAGGAVVLETETASPEFVLDNAFIAASLGGDPSGARVRAAQISAAYGPGAAGEIVI